MRLVLLASVLMVGCAPKRIVSAVTEAGIACAIDCEHRQLRCNDRQELFCGDRMETCLMGCEGARIDGTPEPPVLLPPQ